jgi:hypothetical protein
MDIDIDVADPSPARLPSPWRRSARQIFVAIAGAAALSFAMPVLSQPLGDDDDDDTPFVHHHHKHASPAADRAPPPVEIEVTEPFIALVSPPKPRLSEGQMRKGARDVAEKSAFLQVLEQSGASEPAFAAKHATTVHAPVDETLAGSFEAEDVGVAMTERGPAFQSCYERALKKDASLAGSFAIAFTIGTEGAVTSAKVEPNDHGGLASCLTHVLEHVRFRAPEAPVDVSRTVKFRRPS